LDVTAEEDGILVVNDAYDPQWTARVDGHKAAVVRCNYMMRGVRVSPGTHRVVFSYTPGITGLVASLVVPIILLGWGVTVRKRRTVRLP
jgi:uncharacterized membrane protein YfhO